MMESRLLKMDYSNLTKQIFDVFGKTRSKIVQENSFGIVSGLNLLNQYMIEIADRALEIEDDVLIELLCDMCILKKVEEEGGEE